MSFMSVFTSFMLNEWIVFRKNARHQIFVVYTDTLGVDQVGNVTLDLVCRISNLQLVDRVDFLS